jgi:hypothetical protein
MPHCMPILRIIGRTLIDFASQKRLIPGRWSNDGSLKPPTALPGQALDQRIDLIVRALGKGKKLLYKIAQPFRLFRQED